MGPDYTYAKALDDATVALEKKDYLKLLLVSHWLRMYEGQGNVCIPLIHIAERLEKEPMTETDPVMEKVPAIKQLLSWFRKNADGMVEDQQEEQCSQEPKEAKPLYYSDAVSIASAVAYQAKDSEDRPLRDRAVELLIRALPWVVETHIAAAPPVAQAMLIGSNTRYHFQAPASKELFVRSAEAFFAHVEPMADLDVVTTLDNMSNMYIHLDYGKREDDPTWPYRQKAMDLSLDYLETRTDVPLDTLMDKASSIMLFAERGFNKYDKPPSERERRAAVLILNHAQDYFGENSDKTLEYVERVVNRFDTHKKSANKRHEPKNKGKNIPSPSKDPMFLQAYALLVSLREKEKEGEFSPQTPKGALANFLKKFPGSNPT